MKKRGIVRIILLSIITGGIYTLYWFVKLTNDSNTICPEKKTAGGGKALLFSIITCGVYMIYWVYKLGQKLTGKGTLYLVLSLLGLGAIAMLMGQSKVNAYIDAHANDAAPAAPEAPAEAPAAE